MSVDTADRSAAMAEGRRADSDRRRKRVLAVIADATANGEELSASTIARRAGVDRSFLYRHRDLLEQLHALASRPPAANAATVSRASIEAELADVKIQLAERTDELAAARSANRELFSNLNTRTRHPAD